MSFVEHRLTVPTWASRISVQRDGETLEVRGEDRSPTLVQTRELPLGEDLLQQYNESKRWTKKGTTAKAPHIQFANATSDDALIAFVKRFGPIQTKDALWRLPGGTVIAYQDMPGLRRDRSIFSGAAKLVVARDRGDVDARNMMVEGLGEIVLGVLQSGLPAKELHTEPTTPSRHRPAERWRACPPQGHEQDWYGLRVFPLVSLCSLEVTTDLPPDAPINDGLRSISSKRLREISQIALCC
jgi:hypothetical protein